MAKAKPAASSKLIYFFGKSKCDGKGDMKALLGGKGANLAAMTRIGLPVPPGFTITTEVCMGYYANGKKYPRGPHQRSRQSCRLDGKGDRQEVRRPKEPAAWFQFAPALATRCPA